MLRIPRSSLFTLRLLSIFSFFLFLILFIQSSYHLLLVLIYHFLPSDIGLAFGEKKLSEMSYGQHEQQQPAYSFTYSLINAVLPRLKHVQALLFFVRFFSFILYMLVLFFLFFFFLRLKSCTTPTQSQPKHGTR